MDNFSVESEQIISKISDKLEKEKERKPWDKLPTETNKAYTAFTIYLQFGVQRSLAKVAQHLNKSKRNIEKWSIKYNWVERVTQFDEEQQKDLVNQEVLEHHANLFSLKKKALETASALHRITVHGLNKLYKRIESLTDQDIEGMDAFTTFNMAKNLSVISAESLDSYARALGIEELMASVNLEQNSTLGQNKASIDQVAEIKQAYRENQQRQRRRATEE